MCLRKLITKVRNVLESQSPSPVLGRHNKGKRSQQDVITLSTDPQHFEVFLRSISRCDSLLDARRLKNDIVGEIRRTRTLLGMNFLTRKFSAALTLLQRNTRMKIGSVDRKRKMWLPSLIVFTLQNGKQKKE